MVGCARFGCCIPVNNHLHFDQRTQRNYSSTSKWAHRQVSSKKTRRQSRRVRITDPNGTKHLKSTLQSTVHKYFSRKKNITNESATWIVIFMEVQTVENATTQTAICVLSDALLNTQRSNKNESAAWIVNIYGGTNWGNETTQ